MATGSKTGKKKVRERKDRLLQARITPSLYEQVVDRAEAMKIPVSNLVRILVEDSLKLVDGVVDESLNIAQIFSEGGKRKDAGRARARTAAAAPPSPADESPVAWQAVVMGRRGVCGDCGCLLYPATEAHMGLGSDGRPLLFLCNECHTVALQGADDAENESP